MTGVLSQEETKEDGFEAQFYATQTIPLNDY